MDYRIFVVLAPPAAVVLAITAIHMVRFRTLRISRAILAYVAAVAVLLAANTAELFAATPLWTLAFARIVHGAWHAAVISWFAFGAVYSGHEHLSSRRSIVALAVFPLVFNLLLNTGVVDPWFYRSVEFFRVAGFLTLRANYGPLFWINGLYLYVLLFGGVYMILRAALDRPHWYQRQTLLLVSGALVPVALNVLYVFRLVPALQKDYTSLGFAFSGLAFYFGVQRYRLLGRRPISRSAALEDVRSAVLVLDSHRTILDTNPEARRLMRTPVQEGSLADALLEGVPVGQHQSFETSVDVDGIRTFDVTIRPIIERTGVHLATVATITETTAWVRLKQQTQEIQLRMMEQERLATLGLISANIAHEVKNPLTVLRSTFNATAALAHRCDEAGSVQELTSYTDSFERGFERILSVLNTMTGHGKGESDEHIVATDLHGLIDATLQLARSAYTGVVQVKRDFGEIPLLRCKPSSISQVLLNIVLNAVQAIEEDPARGVDLGLLLIRTFSTGDGKIACTILNSGPPIPQDAKERVFEPFFSTKPRGQGSGLGLSITRDIIERLHDGRIEVVEQDGLTGFRFVLPV